MDTNSARGMDYSAASPFVAPVRDRALTLVLLGTIDNVTVPFTAAGCETGAITSASLCGR